MCYNCAMTTSRVTPPIDEEGADVEGVEESRGVVFSIRCRFSRDWASLCLIVATSITHITKK